MEEQAGNPCSGPRAPAPAAARPLRVLPPGSLCAAGTPWAGEIEQKVFQSTVGIGPYIEVAFFHKASRTLLVTDAVISVPEKPSEVGGGERERGLGEAVGWGRWRGLARTRHPALIPRCAAPRPLQLVAPADLLSAAASNFFIRVLAGARAEEPVGRVPLQPTELTPAVRDLGWRRMALQILYIVPGDLRDPTR